MPKFINLVIRLSPCLLNKKVQMLKTLISFTCYIDKHLFKANAIELDASETGYRVSSFDPNDTESPVTITINDMLAKGVIESHIYEIKDLN